MKPWKSRFALLVTVGGALGACATVDGPAGGAMRPATEPVAATEAAVEQARQVLARNARAVAERWQGRSFEEFEASVYREPEGGKYIVNGDTPIADRKHLEEYFETRIQRVGDVQGRLVVNTAGGVDTVWDTLTQRALSYCVSRDFGSDYQTVVDAMGDAAAAWQRAADIRFVHADTQDAGCTATNPQVVFDVRPVSGRPYLARAFFPDDARGARNVLIDDSALNLDPAGNLDLTGILRHELGHALGFRHEHTRPEAGTCFEDDNWRPLTSYDAFSVMHYPQCNGAGDWSLTLTDIDESGAACLYGPAPGFTIDTSICQPPAPPPQPPPCGPRTVTETGSVARGGEVPLGPYAVAPGTDFEARMSGSGDPDLYVRFGQPPTTAAYDCRPYLSGAVEACELTVPAGATEAHVMVRGYEAGSYVLMIEHNPGG